MSDDVEEAFIITYCISGKIFIRMLKPERKGPAIVHGFLTEQEALGYFERGYAKAHKRGGGWSAGAMIQNIQMQPRVHHTTMTQLKELCGPEPRLHSFRGDSCWGEVGVLLPDNEQTRAFREAGTVPDLTGGLNEVSRSYLDSQTRGIARDQREGN